MHSPNILKQRFNFCCLLQENNRPTPTLRGDEGAPQGTGKGK